MVESLARRRNRLAATRRRGFFGRVEEDLMLGDSQNSESTSSPSKVVKRRRRMIRPDLQWKVILGIVGVSLVITLINAHIPLLGLWKFKDIQGPGNQALVQHMETVIIACFAISLFLTLSLSTWLGTALSFRFCGPIFAMKRYLLGLRDGTWGHECHLREKDDLQDFKDALNEGVAAMRSRIVAQQEALVAAEAVLDGAKPGTEEADALELIRCELREFAIRFEDTDTPFEEAVEEPEIVAQS